MPYSCLEREWFGRVELRAMRKDEETKWMDKAQEALDAAKSMKERGSKAVMITIAKGYMALAKHARERTFLREFRKRDGEDGGP
jgi:hypothetical protein